MRQDQFERLLALSEKLTDVVLADVDPDNWSAAGTPPKDMTKDERGDAYWCRKNAMASTALLVRVFTLTGHVQRANAEGGGGAAEIGPGEGDETTGLLDQEIDAAERQARKLLEQAMKRERAGSA